MDNFVTLSPEFEKLGETNKPQTLYDKIVQQNSTQSEVNNFKMNNVKVSFSDIRKALASKDNYSKISIGKNIDLSNASYDNLSQSGSWKDLGSKILDILNEGLEGLVGLKDFSINVIDSMLTDWFNDDRKFDKLLNKYNAKKTAKESEKTVLTETSGVTDVLDKTKSKLQNEHSPVWALVSQKPDLMANMYELLFYYSNENGDVVDSNPYTSAVNADTTANSIFNTRIRGIKIPTKKQSTFDWNTPTGKMAKVASDFSHDRTLELELDLDQPLFVFDVVNGKVADMKQYSSRMQKKAANFGSILESIPAVYQRRHCFTIEVALLNRDVKDVITQEQLAEQTAPSEMMRAGDRIIFEGVRFLGRTSSLSFKRETAEAMTMTAKFTFKKVYKTKF